MNGDYSLEERQILDQVDTYLARGLALKRWWDRKQATGSNFEERFPLAFTFNRPDFSYGFFDRAPVDGRSMPILGNFQGQFYDQPKSDAPEPRRSAQAIDEELRPFVLRYFMRVADFRDPQAFPDEPSPEPPFFLKPFSMCTGRNIRRVGFGYQQLFYKRAGSGEIGRFPEDRRRAILDMREIGPRFEWVVLRVKIFDFNFQIQPFGSSGPTLTIPSDEHSFLVVSRPFVTHRAQPRPGVLAQYGFGYAFLKNPEPSVLAWGPGKFDAAFQTLDWEVFEDGRIRVGMVFVANRPAAIARIPLNPALLACTATDMVLGEGARALTAPFCQMAAALPGSQLSFDPVYSFVTLANLATAGFAGRELCISRQQLEKQLIMTHFQKHYAAISGSLQTWRQIRNWDDERSLPRWVISGEST